jgi:hypothetical protein
MPDEWRGALAREYDVNIVIWWAHFVPHAYNGLGLLCVMTSWFVMNQGVPDERRGELYREYYVNLANWWAKLQYSGYANCAKWMTLWLFDDASLIIQVISIIYLKFELQLYYVEQDRQRSIKVTLRRFRVTIVAVQKQ